jgi:hypothetical protein
LKLLKELTEREIVQPSLVSIEKNIQGTVNLILKIDCGIDPLNQFVAEKSLSIKEEKGLCIISKQ